MSAYKALEVIEFDSIEINTIYWMISEAEESKRKLKSKTENQRLEDSKQSFSLESEKLALDQYFEFIDQI